MPTTYQLTADDMISRHGESNALYLAEKFAARKGEAQQFWRYVAQCIRQTCDRPMDKGTLVTIRTNNGGEITAPLALNYRPTYCATIDVNGHAVVILATRITSIRKA